MFILFPNVFKFSQSDSVYNLNQNLTLVVFYKLYNTFTYLVKFEFCNDYKRQANNKNPIL